MQRRSFIYLSVTGCLSLGLSVHACKNKTHANAPNNLGTTAFEALSFDLLKTWCDALIDTQINEPSDSTIHGALYCEACKKIHGRCMDAVYPFLFMADSTGERKYLDAAILVMKWSENVSMPDGSWTVIPDPKSWRGITVFGALALGEALHYHGHILSKELYDAWKKRLRKASEFIHANFTIDYSHINYAFTAVYALNFLGRMFDETAYIEHSRQLAGEIPNWLTKPNMLIFGEDKPADEVSAKGLLPVDLGYNVEESLNGLVQYAKLEQDEELLKLLDQSLAGHLEFMLPDGGWDNSWGTRQNKWSYWGSRTTDGCQPAFVLMADRNPAFGKAVLLNTQLLKRCTVNGLLAGGLHYESHNIPACIHHTFAHAKNIAFMLNHPDIIKKLDSNIPIPRSTNDGVKHFPELDVWLIARGPWRATVSSYDQIFKKKYSVAATGGSLAILWHEKTGPLFTASMAEYLLVEKNNQQSQPGEDFALMPRIERYVNGVWYTNIQDLKAEVEQTDDNETIQFKVKTALTNRDKQVLKDANSYQLTYSFDKSQVTITARRPLTGDNGDQLVLPIISPSGESIIQESPNRVRIVKSNSQVILEANAAINSKKNEGQRIFNMVPGVEAIPFIIKFPKTKKRISCTIKVL
ncbi:hypothetical protein [Spongiivirga citrea]|uniref:Heparinase n=1 Tax=Spongiivirga citrea TaxID=1481457 RepID=A0A6M0CIM6_9FLAO|nr:hypothetical protein [Spongiivirga citrea]NER17808.1 hypothetical protein [Spongiivirga citrea]